MQSNVSLFAAVGAWIAQDPDPVTQQQLRALLQAEDTATLAAMFAGRIAFGTAGLRAVMGPGPQHMNRLVVRQSVLGVLRVLQSEVHDACTRGVVVAYDGRLKSHEMALDAAGVLAAQGAHVHLFDRAVPTPIAGFACKTLRAAGAIVITASHNPPAYNGLKVFWHDAAQIVPPLDSTIAAKIDAVVQEHALDATACWEPDKLAASDRVSFLGQEMIDAYVAAIERHGHHPAVPARKHLGIAYTPLHGVGAQVAEAALAQAGFAAVHTVQSQREPDGHFPTVPFPNPEEPGSMDAVLALAQTTQAALACANDPDADRLAVAARNSAGELTALTGDELGLLLADDALRHNSAHAAVGTTLVSARALKTLAGHYGAHYFETLTGFKWLAQQARSQSLFGRTFVMAYEEALGYALGDVVWDKDGISALLAVAKLAAHLDQAGQTLWHRLADIARVTGIAVSRQATIALDAARAHGLMAHLRAQPPQRVGAFEVIRVTDLLRPEDSQALALPAADVLLIDVREREPTVPELTHGRIIVRPSGTEPKVKCYYDMLALLPETSEAHRQQTWAHTRFLTQQKLTQLMQAHALLLQKN